MLGKLIKYEFRATARVMLPVFIALLSLSVVTHLTSRFFLNGDVHWVLSALGVLMITAARRVAKKNESCKNDVMEA